MIICLLLSIPIILEAQVAVDQEPLVFSSPQQQGRFKSLTEESFNNLIPKLPDYEQEK